LEGTICNSFDGRSGTNTGAIPKKRKRASLEGTYVSFDARSKGQPRPLPLKRGIKNWKLVGKRRCLIDQPILFSNLCDAGFRRKQSIPPLRQRFTGFDELEDFPFILFAERCHGCSRRLTGQIATEVY